MGKRVATNRLKFSNRRVADLDIPTDRAAWFYDTQTPGFAVTVSPAGKRVFYFVGRIRGRPSRVKLGVFPAVSVDDARDAVKVNAGEVAKGRDIRDRRRAGRATLDYLFDHYIRVHAKPTKRTWERDEREYNRLLKPEFGAVPLAHVRRIDVEKLIARIEDDDGRGPARKARALLSKMFEVGIAGGWCEANPVRGTRRPEFDPRQRYLKADEVAAFVKAIDELRSETARDFFRLALFTGARRSNVASMRWEELEISLGLWRIPALKAKGKKAQTIPLSSHALQVIQSRRNNGSPFVFPGRGKSGHYAEPKDAWRRVLKLSGLSDLRIHDLRRSLGAWQQRSGASLRTIQATLGHSDPSITARVYSPMEFDQVRAASQAAVDAMLGATK